MARLTILPLPENSHFGALIGAAKVLRRAAHDVVVAGPEDFRVVVESAGLPFQPLLSRTLPKGWFAGHRAKWRRALVSPTHEDEPRLRIISEAGSAVERLTSLRSDLILVDDDNPLMAFLYEARLPLGVLLATLGWWHTLQRPDVGVDFIPPPGFLPRLRWRLAQWSRGLSWTMHERSRQLACGVRGIPYGRWRRLHRLAVAAQYSSGKPPLPGLILCPAEFDVPTADVPGNVRYGPPTVDTERSALPFDWQHLERDPRPLVYIAFGMSDIYRVRNLPIAAALRGAAAQRNDLAFLVVSTGEGEEWEPLRRLPNVLVASHVPQLEVLKRASIMVTHGGLNSVKECILAAVPMVVYPLAADGFGNAARITLHGLGVRLGTIDRVGISLSRAIREVETNHSVRKRVSRMARVFKEREGAGLLERFVDDVLRGEQSIRPAQGEAPLT